MASHTQRPNRSVVVGVDGSRAALNAVAWAAAEAVDRGIPLRLVHVAGGMAPDAVLEHAEDVARQAEKSVRVETIHACGDPAAVLACESRSAAMVCLGSRARAFDESALFGPVATALIERATGPVAIIRSRADGTPRTEGVVSVVLSDDAANDEVVHAAMREGRLRRATVRQIDQRTDSWVRRFPDVHVEVVTDGSGVRSYGHCGEPDQRIALAVIGPGDAETLTSTPMPNCHPIHGYPDCSVLVVRG
ncbi:MAG: universal stress protein [Actinomycetota bacterium]|nr:universal stress protein [Actinomycetota bacterium]